MAHRRTDHLNDPVSKHMRRDFVSVLENQTAGEALAHVQRGETSGRIVYFYVVDADGRLRGVLPTRRLLLSAPETPITEGMVKNVIALPETATLLDACELFILHRLLAFPVVDYEGRVQGVVDVELYTEEISELARRDESDDVFQLIGVHLAQVQQASVPGAFGRRFPWLLCNIGGGLACAFLAWMFEATLNQVVALSMFIPVVLAVAESVSIQTLSLTLQARHGQFRWTQTLRELVREIPVGILLGFASGGMVGGIAFIWLGESGVALTIIFGMTAAVATAATLGLVIPTLFHVVERDPRIASGPITLALTDLGAMFYYLGLAYLLV